MLRALLLLPFCLLFNFAVGQTNSEKRSLSPFLVFDSYYSFIGNKSADVWGFKGGVKIDEKWRLGVGYNLLSSDIVEQKVLPSEELAYAKNDTVKAQLFFRYFLSFFLPVAKSTKLNNINIRTNLFKLTILLFLFIF